MWTRKEIKTQAKEFLRGNYLKALLVCLILTILTAGFGNTNSHVENRDDLRNNEVYEEFQENLPEGIVGDSVEDGLTKIPRIFGVSVLPTTIMGITFIAMILGTLIGLFFTNVLEIGVNKFFLDGFNGDVRIGNMFSIFSQKNYMNMVLTQLKRNLFTALWALLFIIPGIIKSYQYIMIPYILADSPELDSSEVFERSKILTDGNKFNIFVLSLSFLGWYILVILTFGIGMIFLSPYIKATYAKLYEQLKIEKGFVVESDVEIL